LKGELIGIKVVKTERIKKCYKPKKILEFVSVEIYLNEKYGAVAMLHPMKTATDRMFDSFKKAEYHDDGITTKRKSNKKPDDASIKMTLATNLLFLEVLIENTPGWYQAQGKAEILHGLLNSKSTHNPQVFDNSAAYPYLLNVIKVLDGSAHDNFSKITEDKEKNIDRLADEYTKAHLDALNNMVILRGG
jgi:hypothetical protein